MVSYCGRDCQKNHWKSHKATCKSVVATGAPAPKSNGSSSGSTLESQWRQALGVSQRNGNDLESAQILYNLSCLSLRGGNWKEAQRQAEEARGCTSKLLGPESESSSQAARELHVVANISRALALIESRQMDLAEDCCLACVTEAETLFGPVNQHLVKALRVWAMLQDRCQAFDASASLLQRALAVAYLHFNTKVNQEIQELVDELVKQLLHCGRSEEALEVGRQHFAAASEGASDVHMAECMITFATVLGKSGRLDEAEEHARSALALREKTLGEGAPLTAVAMTVLAGVLEDQGELGDETESLLLRASVVFQRSDGSRSNANMVLSQLQRVRARRGEDHGGMLMRKAAIAFETKDFKRAEALLTEAVQYFASTLGPTHVNTATSMQNLQIARQNVIIQLWREVVVEEAAKEDLLRDDVVESAARSSGPADWESELRSIGAAPAEQKTSCVVS